MQIRKATTNDVNNIARLEKSCFSTEAWNSNSILESLDMEYRLFFVASDGECHLGHGCITNICGEGEITNIAVDPRYRQKGIGRSIVEKLLAAGREAGDTAFTLEVRQNNSKAIALYESLGFVSEGIRPHFYSDPDEGANIMWLRE